jgi:RNA polymerase sigma-70 factor (ECF subfamily)
MEGGHETTGGEDDDEIIRKIRAGDVDAFASLVERHQHRVAGVVARHIPPSFVAEVAHDAIVDAFRSLPKFRGDCEFSTWLCRIAIRRSCDFWRARKHDRDGVSLDEVSEEQQRWLDRASLASSDAERERAASQGEAVEILDRVLGQLGPEDRMIVTLLHLEGRAIREIAESLGWSEVRVKVRAMRARRALRGYVEKLLEKKI